jgi:hypothetical protein
LIKTATDKGELDAQIDSVSQIVKAGFKRDKTERKNTTLRLPNKTP